MSVVLTVLNVIIAVGYPLAIWYGLERMGSREVGLIALALALPLLLLRLKGARREHLLAVLRVPLAVIGLILLTVALDDRRFMLALPVLINGLFLAWFAASLREGMPAIERFARMQKDTLTEAEAGHCRHTTLAWCGFFVVNGGIAGALALAAPVSWWAFYTGFAAYAFMGAFHLTEFTIRKYRFRTYLGGPLDPIYRRIFPPHPADEEPV